MSYSKLTLIGNLGGDPELRYTGSNVPVCTFSVAENIKLNGQEQTQWYKVTFWREDAERAHRYLAKGRQVYVEGTLVVRTYESKGRTCVALDVTGTVLRFIGAKPETAEHRLPATEQVSEEDSIPFGHRAEAAPPAAPPRTRRRTGRPPQAPPPDRLDDHRTNPEMGF